MNMLVILTYTAPPSPLPPNPHLLDTLQLLYLKPVVYYGDYLTCIDLKVQLQATDYGNFLQNEPSPIPVSVIDEKLRNHLVVEFQHMRNQSVEPLSNFLDYITYVECVTLCVLRVKEVSALC